MEFCNVCDNMLYLSVKNGSLEHECRKCGTSVPLHSTTRVLSRTNYKRTDQKQESLVNEYTCLDPTLPRVNTIPCPNQACPGKEQAPPPEVIYIRYDAIDLRFMYLCSECKTTWTVGKN